MAPKKRRVSVARLSKFQPMSPYKKVLRSKETVAGIVAREGARREGKKAAVAIAKARAAKAKKAPLTQEAKRLHRQSQSLWGGQRTILSHAENKNFTKRTGIRSRLYLGMHASERKLMKNDPSNLALAQAAELRKKQEVLRGESKSFARRSGGHATAMKRNAEAGIAHIARGRAMKGMARVSGVLGIASLFAQHLAGGKDKKNG